MNQGRANCERRLTRSELLAVLAWVVEHYCGSGVVEIEAHELVHEAKCSITRTRDTMTITFPLGENKWLK